jgi:hypothetical protein
MFTLVQDCLWLQLNGALFIQLMNTGLILALSSNQLLQEGYMKNKENLRMTGKG